MHLPLGLVRPFVLGGAILSLAGAALGAGETIHLRADSWMPFNGDPQSDQPGYVVEIVKAIFGPLDIKVDYQLMPWEAALKAAAANEIDGVIGASRTEAAHLVVPAESIGVNRVALFVLKGKAWTYSSIKSLEEIHLGAIEGYDYWPSLNTYIQNHQPPLVILFKGETPLRDAIAKLQAGEIDVMPETTNVFYWAVKHAELKPADFHPVYIHEGDEAFVAFAPKGAAGQHYAQLFDQGLQRIRQNGQLAKILKTYGVDDWR